MEKNKVYLRVIIALSVIIPVVVALLLYTPFTLGLSGSWIKKLPALNAIFNSTTSLCLIGALVAIRKKNITLHRNLMFIGLILGVCFLISYVLYHSNSTSVIYGDLNGDGALSAQELSEVGTMRSVYIFILLSHIVLSVMVVPLVLFAFYLALTNQIIRHKKVVKFAFPIWLYVSITGVVVYLMISPYYL